MRLRRFIASSVLELDCIAYTSSVKCKRIGAFKKDTYRKWHRQMPVVNEWHTTQSAQSNVREYSDDVPL